MCVSLLSVLVVLNCVFSELCFSVFVYLFVVMSCLLFFCVYFVYDSYTNDNCSKLQ